MKIEIRLKYFVVALSTMMILSFGLSAQSTFTAQTPATGATSWDRTAVWVDGVVPNCDGLEISIIIPSGVVMRMGITQILSCQVNITIEAGAELILVDRNGDAAELDLGVGSTITLEGDATISTAAQGGGGDADTPTIIIDGTEVFSGDDDDVIGPGVLDGSSVDGSLPVELVSFQCIIEGNEILLKWITASELNNEGFYIEGSLNTEAFEELGFVSGNGTTNETNTYSFEAPDLYSYFRLKQIDFDGEFEYSSVIKNIVDNELVTKKLSFYPNPIQGDKIQMLLPTNELKEFQIVVSSMAGEQIQIIEGTIFNSRSVYLETLQPGVYLFETSIGNEKSIKRIQVK